MPATISDQRFAAGNRDHRRAAFIDGVETLRNGQPLVEDRIGIIDFAAAGAGQIAAEQRLQHQHERIARAPSQTLAHYIGADLGFLSQRYTQDNDPL